MMHRTPPQALEDALIAIDEIQSIIGKKDLTKAFTNLATRRAIERCLQILTEAVGHIPANLTKHHPGVNWKAIRATGNFLRHEFANVSAPVPMNVVRDHLKPLKKACQAIQAHLLTRQELPH